MAHIITTVPAVGPDPSRAICPSCRANIVTRVVHEANTKTHILAVLLCLFFCWPCVCVPYCTDSCRSANHYCSNCGTFIGSYNG